MKQLTEQQSKFLDRVKDEYPFRGHGYRISVIRNVGQYTHDDAKVMNVLIKEWKKTNT